MLSNPAQLFGERLREYDASVQYLESGELSAAISEILSKHGTLSLAVPDDLPPLWLTALSNKANFELCRDQPQLDRNRLKDVEGSLTSCAVAIAETGTIILDGGKGQGRRILSLLPDLLIVVVSSVQIVNGVPEAISKIDPILPQTWISGPSATSDIELSRVEGVHGPRVLEVLVIDEDESIDA
jgi:L-lactate dehydrogenase complex protein LldG